ncbi:MAG TPA: S-layer homology domain-containing protein [Acidimicrobiia bacterium]|jgi:hypothetical protein
MVRTLLGFAVLVLVLVGLPAHADAPNTYVDDDHSRYEGYIEAASAAGLVSGCNPPENNRFCPHREVSRGEMAIMLARGLRLPSDGGDHFSDDDGIAAESSIDALAAAGITDGCSQGRFCPDSALTRGEMAQLIADALGWTQKANTERYADLKGSLFAGALTALASRGGIEPCDLPEDLRLCPDSPVTRDEAAFAVVTALGMRPTSISRSSGPAVGFVDSFDTLRLWDGQRPSTRNRVGLTDAGYRGNALKVRMPSGSHYGADFELDLSRIVGEDPEVLYFRYFLRVEPGWDPIASGKLPGFSGIYNHTGKGGYPSKPSSPGWSARMKFAGNRPDDPRARLGYYVYHLGQERRYGDGMQWNEAGKLQPGEWYCIEGQIQLNTPGVADGALRGWVDGTPAFEATGIEFRRPDEPEIRIESFWFNVYYGGKPTANKDLGLTFDEVAVDGKRIGCGNGPGQIAPGTGDYTGDGFADWITWAECATGPCFHLRSTTEDGVSTRSVGNGAWFSLETGRLGIVVADVNGDGNGDVIYRGRCGRSERCWRVHRGGGAKLGPGEDWGDGARFSPASRLVAGDFDGDGLADITYSGLCGADAARPCWRTHISTGEGFSDGADWGPPMEGYDIAPEAADMDGDGKDDIVFAGACDAGTCWFMQTSNGHGFDEPVRMGEARRWELNLKRLFDFDGDGRKDLLTAAPLEDGSSIELRELKGDKLARYRIVATVPTPVTDLVLRRYSESGPIEALAVHECKAVTGCVKRFFSLDDELASPERYARAQFYALTRQLARVPASDELIFR